jgi:hypothetical protein
MSRSATGSRNSHDGNNHDERNVQMARFYIHFNTAARPGRGAEYSEWCRIQHPDIMRVPGVVSARRYKALDRDGEDRERFIAVIEVEGDDPRAVLREISARSGTPEMPGSDCYDPSAVTIAFTEFEAEWRAAE